MENKIIFREMLTEIKKAADAAGNIITKDEVRNLLAGLPLEEEHFKMVYEYLDSQKIRVVESKEEAQEALLEEPKRGLSLYLEELSKLSGEAIENEHELIRQAMLGDEKAKSALIESYLPLICEMAGEYSGTEIPAEDLIQEGNLGLLMAMNKLAKFDNPAAGRAHLINSINQAMEQAIEMSRESKQMDEGIVSRVNHLKEAVDNLERDLGHKVSAEELSAYLEMPLEEIRDVLRMSGDQFELEEK